MVTHPTKEIGTICCDLRQLPRNSTRIFGTLPVMEVDLDSGDERPSIKFIGTDSDTRGERGFTARLLITVLLPCRMLSFGSSQVNNLMKKATDGKKQ